MSNTDLWKKHQVELCYAGKHCYLKFNDGTMFTPSLNEAILQWRSSNGEPFTLKDLIPNLVAVPRNLAVNEYANETSIRCRPVTWAQYRTMCIADKERMPQHEQFHVLSVAYLVVASDDFLIPAMRSRTVSHYPNMWHASAAGYLELDIALGGGDKIFNAALTEIEEEVGLKSNDLRDIGQLGLIRHLAPGSASMEFCGWTLSKLTAAEILERARNAKDSWEGKHSAFTRDQILEMLQSDEHRFNPAGAATLLMYLGILPD